MTHLLDASILVSFLFAEPNTPQVRRKLLETDGLIISTFAIGEVASAFSRRVRMKEMSLARARAALADFDTWREQAAETIEVEPADIRRAAALVRQFALKLKMPDALHLAMAESRSDRLLTSDDRLADAAAQLSVSCWSPASEPA